MEPFTIPDRPPALPVTKECIYRKIGNINLPSDIFLPRNRNPLHPHPVMVYIHGGGFIGGDCTDYSRPLFQRFLSAGFIVISMGYRLLPETSLDGLLEDVRYMESWLRNCLPSVITSLTVDRENIIVVGASAGALLALLTPILWIERPTAILSMYGPTNLHNVPYLGIGRLSKFPLVPPTAELLDAATNFEAPPTEFAPPSNKEDLLKPRAVMGRIIFQQGLMTDFLINGLQNDGEGRLKLPEKGSASVEQIDAISPQQLIQHNEYPPTCLMGGEEDDVFHISHVHDFHEALQQRGVNCKKIVVPHKGHAFDIWEEIGSGSDIDRAIGESVKWLTSWCTS